MNDLSPADLPLALRLALSYAPATSRASWSTFFHLDSRFAGFLAQSSEGVLVQMRLAWWRDTLGVPVGERPQGDPILAATGRNFLGQEDALIALANGWERLVEEPPLSTEAIGEFVEGRARVAAAIAEMHEGPDPDLRSRVAEASRHWAHADLVAHSSDAQERATILRLAQGSACEFTPLTRGMRPIAVLAALGRRSLTAGGAPLLSGRGATLLAMRVGMFGR